MPLGIIHRRAVIQTRISRCFFSPHYGSESDGELADDIDYYPENYLNRLAHEGVNGLWIQEHLRKILSSDIIPEYGNESAERIRRLNRVIDRCKRYGIKIYLEGVEPASTYNNPALLNHPDVLGQPFGDYYAFCISTPKGQSYIKESITKLFTLIPDLQPDYHICRRKWPAVPGLKSGMVMSQLSGFGAFQSGGISQM